MEIGSERIDTILTVTLTGRLDAFGAKQLTEALKNHVTDDDFTVVIDMGGVPYLSSGGIRTLLATEKMLRNRDGGIHLCNVNPYPLKVLEMAGFDQFFSIHSSREDAIKSCVTQEAMRGSKIEWDQLPQYRKNGALFTVFNASPKEAVLKVAGDISKVLYAQLEEEDIVSRRFSETEYSIGLGALGMTINDCMPLFGEMITTGGTMVWLPTDGNDTPDFLIPKRDTGEVTIHTGFNVALDGTFNDIMIVEREDDSGITISDLYAAVFEIAKEQRPDFKGLVSIAMRADIHAMYSSGVSISPIKKFAPENREMIMHEDNIDTWVAINTVPKYRGETMVGFGMGIDLSSDLSSFDRDSLNALFYLHPANVGNKTMLLHNHGVVFKHLPWERNVNLDEEIKKIVTEGEFIDMRHLLDNMSITRAVIGVSYISDIIFEGKLRIDIVGECPGWNDACARITQKLHPDCSELRLTPISGGYSGSLVFKVNAWDRSGRKEMPFVLKIDKWSAIHDEIRGYTEHVKRYIQNNATQIIQQCKLGDYGGILYNFVGIKGTDSEISCLEDYYFSHTAEEVLPLFDHLFRVALRTWYGQPKLKEISLYEEYGSFDRYDEMKNYVQEHFGVSEDEETIELPFGMGISANPLYFITNIIPERKSNTVSVYEASVHGDLNMKNVLMDEDKNMWLIDFSKTGHSHILRDIAKLEAVLKFETFEINSDKKLREIVELEKIFLDVKDLSVIPQIPSTVRDLHVLKAFLCVQKLREYANVITLLDEDITQYFFSLFAYTMRVLKYGSANDYAKKCAWISSSMLCQKLI
jgi:anti-anti-sigma factor